MTHTAISTSEPGPPCPTEAYAAVEKAARSRCGLYAPSVLEHAADLLADLWAAGECRGVLASEWGWAVDLPGGALDVVSRRYEHPETERTGEQVTKLCKDLVAALTAPEIGMSVEPGTRKNVAIIKRLPRTPRGGLHGDANLIGGIYSNSGWDLSMNADGAPVLSIAAPVTTAGVAEVAALVRDVARGRLGDPFRR